MGHEVHEGMDWKFQGVHDSAMGAGTMLVILYSLKAHTIQGPLLKQEKAKITCFFKIS